jgi:hypothetical protein
MLLNVPRATAIMGREGLEGMVGSSPENIAYLTSLFDPNLWMCRGMKAYAVIAAGVAEPLRLILPRSDLDLAAASPLPCDRIVSCGSIFC